MVAAVSSEAKGEVARKAGADEVVIWGSGTPRREFLHVDDMAAGSLFVMDLKPDVYRRETQPMLSQVNIGSGVDVTIRELAEIIAKITGFQGQLVVDLSKPDGTPQKLLDVSRLKKLGWTAAIELEDGIRNTYQWYLNQSPEHLRSQ